MSTKQIPSALRRLPRRRASLVAGALALGLAGAMSLQTVVPGQFALADPVRVETEAPQNFAPVVSAVKPAVVSVRVRTSETPRMMSSRDGGIPGFEDLPQDHPRCSASSVASAASPSAANSAAGSRAVTA